MEPIHSIEGSGTMHNSDDHLRRSACDRCRGQKLRCERQTSLRSRQSDGACRRCHRAGADCVTSSPLRPGRPRISHTAAVRSRRNSQDQISNTPKRSTGPENSFVVPSIASSIPSGVRDQSSDNEPFWLQSSFDLDMLNPAFDVSRDVLSESCQPPESTLGFGTLGHESLNQIINSASPFTNSHDTEPWGLLTSGMSTSSPRNIEKDSEPSTVDRMLLYRQFSELSHTVSIDASKIQPCNDSAEEQLSEILEDGSTFITRAIKSAETFRCLLEKLRRKSKLALVSSHGIATPVSRRQSYDTSSTVEGTVNLAADSNDAGLDQILALHVETCCLGLHRIFKGILNYIMSAVLCSNGKSPSVILPDIQFAALPFNDVGYLRLRLFVEACMHLMASIHRILEQDTTGGTSKSNIPLLFDKTVVAIGGISQRVAQQRAANLHQIRELCTQISATIEQHC